MPRLMHKHREELKSKPNKTDPKLIGWVNDLLNDIIDKDEFLKRYAPFLTIIDIIDNIIYLKDAKLKRSVEVYLKNQQLYCEYDRSFNCIHVHYSFAIPEIAKLNLNHISK